VPAIEAFYRTVLDLEPEPEPNACCTPAGGYAGTVAFVTDGAAQLHLAEKDLGVSFRTSVDRSTDDIEAFKRRLTEKGIAYPPSAPGP